MLKLLFSICAVVIPQLLFSMGEKSLLYKTGYSLGYFVGLTWPYLLLAFVAYVLFRYWKKKRNEQRN